jgi:DNA anti-recombination protein RmuC
MDLWKEQYSLGSTKVDFIVYMPNARILPIDSKTSGMTVVREYQDLGDRVAAATDDETRKQLLGEQGKLITKIRTSVLNGADQVASYIQPERGTLALAVQAVPDSIFAVLDTRTRRGAAEINVQIVPYGLLIPVVNVLRSLSRYDKIDFQAVVAAMEGIRLQSTGIQDVLRTNSIRPKSYCGAESMMLKML